MSENPIFDELMDTRKLSQQEGRNQEREIIISWLNKQSKKTIKIEEFIKELKSWSIN
jgi:hypothetical protein